MIYLAPKIYKTPIWPLLNMSLTRNNPNRDQWLGIQDTKFQIGVKYFFKYDSNLISRQGD